jgi:hypothetical protein
MCNSQPGMTEARLMSRASLPCVDLSQRFAVLRNVEALKLVRAGNPSGTNALTSFNTTNVTPPDQG